MKAHWVAMLLCVWGCAPDLRRDFPFDGELPEGSYVEFVQDETGLFDTQVNATFKESWVYVDFDAPKEMPASEAIATAEWDVAFQRFKIISNGGVSGPGNVAVAILKKQDFEALDQAPSEGYLQDAPDSQTDGDQDVDSPFLIEGAWYYYDLGKHRLTPNDVTYVIRTTAQNFIKLQMQSYYDSNGTSARVSLKWKKIPPPPG